MTPTHDVVQKLLEAVKDIITSFGAHNMHTWETRCMEMVKIARRAVIIYEAQLAGEGKRRYVYEPNLPLVHKALRIAYAMLCQKAGPDELAEFEPFGLENILSSAIDEVNGHHEGPISPTTACIRAAKRVIAALNLPDGAGVAMDESGWNACTSKPIDTESGWFPDEGDEMWCLPPTAITPWPGDFRTSWITLQTEEVTE